MYFERYRRVLDRHFELRENYAKREAEVFGVINIPSGSLVGFYGHENSELNTPALSFGHLIDGPFPVIDDDDDDGDGGSCPFTQVAYILHESGREICVVPIGLIYYVAYPDFITGLWHIYRESPQFDCLAHLFSEETFSDAFTELVLLCKIAEHDYEDSHLSAFHKLIAKYGKSVLTDAPRIKGILLDLAPEPKWGVSVLVQAIELGIVERLISNAAQPYSLLKTALAKRLHDAGPSLDRAEWAIDKWAVVTGCVTQPEMHPFNSSRTKEELNSAVKGDEWFTFEKYQAKRLGMPLAEYLQRKKAHRDGPQSLCSFAEDITPYLNAYIVLSDEEDIFGDVPHWEDDAGVEIKNGAIVRVRDHGGRLMFSYGFVDENSARRVISTLKTFHSNRSKLVQCTRSSALALLYAQPDCAEPMKIWIEKLEDVPNKAMEQLGNAAIGNVSVGLMTTAHATFNDAICELCDYIDAVETNVAVIHAPAESPLWRNVVPFQMAQDNGKTCSVLFKMAFISDEDLSSLVSFAEPSESKADLRTLLLGADGRQLCSLIPGWVSPMRVAEAVANGRRVLQCSSWEQWCSIRDVMQPVLTPDYVYFNTDRKSVVAAITDGVVWFDESGNGIQDDELRSYLEMCDAAVQIYIFKNGGSVIPVPHWTNLHEGTLEGFAHCLVAALCEKDSRAEQAVEHYRLAAALFRLHTDLNELDQEMQSRVEQSFRSFHTELDAALTASRYDDAKHVLLKFGTEVSKAKDDIEAVPYWHWAAARGSFAAQRELYKAWYKDEGLFLEVCGDYESNSSYVPALRKVISEVEALESYLARRAVDLPDPS